MLPWQGIWAVLLIVLGAWLVFKKEPILPINSEKTDSKEGQIYRSTKNKMLGGVCGGLAEHFNIDSSIIRLGYLLLTFASLGIGIVAYFVMFIVFPENPETFNVNNHNQTSIER